MFLRKVPNRQTNNDENITSLLEVINNCSLYRHQSGWGQIKTTTERRRASLRRATASRDCAC